jgi:putative hydrolase of the HAD superfamily
LLDRRPLVVSDADNTLWDTDAVYRRAQLALFDAVRVKVDSASPPPDPLSYLRRIDEQIAHRHPLRWKYPPRILIASLAHALSQPDSSDLPHFTQAPEVLDEPVILDLEHQFLTALDNETPLLRDSVVEGLGELRRIGARIVLATEAAADRCQALLTSHNLLEYITAVHASVKTPALFRAISNLYSADAGAKFMVGDQHDRDIAPAKAAGFVTILFPGGFKPSVEDNHDAIADFVVSKYSEVPTIVLSFDPAARRHAHARGGN